jgi:hypothetical protein
VLRRQIKQSGLVVVLDHFFSLLVMTSHYPSYATLRLLVHACIVTVTKWAKKELPAPVLRAFDSFPTRPIPPSNTRIHCAATVCLWKHHQHNVESHLAHQSGLRVQHTSSVILPHSRRTKAKGRTGRHRHHRRMRRMPTYVTTQSGHPEHPRRGESGVPSAQE